MSFNYGYEKRKFDLLWEKQRKEYLALGMPEEAVDEMYRFDLDVFNRDRAYITHTQRMPDTSFHDDDTDTSDESLSPLLQKFIEQLTVCPQEISTTSRYGWIDEIDNEALAESLKRLSSYDKEIITLIAFDGYSESDVAQQTGVTRSAVCHRLDRIKKRIQKNI